MILQETSSRRLPYWGTAIFLVILVAVTLLLLPKPEVTVIPPAQADPARIACGAEDVIKEIPEGESDSVLLMVGKYGTRLLNGERQSDTQAHSGSFSCKLDSIHNFGMTYVFKDVQANDRYHLSVWFYNTTGFRPSLVSHLIGGEVDDYTRNTYISEVEENGWKQIEKRLAIPYDFTGGELRIYVYGYGLGEAYFDDLRIERKRPSDSMRLAKIPHLDVEIPQKGLKKLDTKRWEAIHRGLLTQGENDWVKADLNTDSSRIPVKLRLKGDLADHFLGDKWSFRVKAKTPYAWNRMITFSLHTPLARDHVSEWLYHTWLRDVDVISPRYDFVHLRINGTTKGLYACEEHFEKQLVEFQERREGPILKFDEAGVWDVRQRAMDYGLDWGEMERETESFEMAHPQAFGESKMLADSVLRKQFEIGDALMQQFQSGEKMTSDIFDLDLLAKYCVITDLTKAYHGMIWHNLRFYYNPITSLLEPIGFDGFTETGAFTWLRRPFLGAKTDNSQGGASDEVQLRRWFLDPDFAAIYHRYLEEWTRTGYVEDRLQAWDADLRQREDLIQLEFPAYAFQPTNYTERAQEIRQLLFPYSNSSLKAYIQETSSDSVQLSLFNHHVTSLEVIGWGRTAKNISTQLDKPLFLFGKGRKAIQEFSLSLPSAANYLYFRVPGLDSVYHSRIFAWTASQIRPPRQQIFADVQVQEGDLYTVENKRIQIKPGKHQLTESLIIPAGYQVSMSAGTEIDLVQQAAIISRSPVFLQGSESQPILIHSSDGTGQGVTVLQAGSESVLHYVQFERLQNLNQAGWTLTGAVCFYESPLRIDHCVFTRNACEDALNIVRSSFAMYNSTISHTFSDGFDADFCRGEVRDCVFSHTGNDGMDFSGSEIRVYDCQVLNAGDKGVSAGEESKIEVWNLSVRESVTAAASKDLSTLMIHSIQIEDCQTGFAAYQKKPEFGGADMTVTRYEATGIRHLHLIDKGSRLVLRGKEVEGI